jgi:hypothetical protein
MDDDTSGDVLVASHKWGRRKKATDTVPDATNPDA